MKNNYYLVLSSCLLLISIIYFIINFRNNNCEILLLLLLLSNVVLSILFWKDAKYKSIEHKIDSLLAKISFIFFVTYGLFIKNTCFIKYKILILILFIITLLLYYLSNKFSSKYWCSRKHIITHSIFHVFIMIGSLVIFI